MCTVELDQFDSDVKGPVYVYYQLDNFYQNHRRYVKSRDNSQLNGIFKLNLLIAFQFVFCHLNDFFTEIWRMQDFPAYVLIIYKLKKWVNIQFDWLETQMPLIILLTVLFYKLAKGQDDADEDKEEEE